MTLPADKIITFPEGLPGLEGVRRFCLVSLGADAPFDVLQAVDNPDIRLVTLDPFRWYPGYAVDLPDAEVEALDLRAPEEAIVRAVVVVRKPLERSTVNLMAPIVINGRTRVGRQVVLHDSPYSLRHPLTEPLAVSGNRQVTLGEPAEGSGR